jgi:hypothetical protein
MPFYRKKQGRDKIKSTGTDGKVPKMVKTAGKLLLVNGLEQSCRGSDSNVELNDTRSSRF